MGDVLFILYLQIFVPRKETRPLLFTYVQGDIFSSLPDWTAKKLNEPMRWSVIDPFVFISPPCRASVLLLRRSRVTV
jgi:hypothetical protein